MNKIKSFIKPDKITHCLFESKFTVFFSFMFNPIIGSIIALIIGALKELLWDKKLEKGNSTWGDMFANVFGIFGGVIEYYVIILYLI